MSLPDIDGNTEKNTAKNIYKTIKDKISSHPTLSIAGLLTAAGLTGAVSFSLTKDPNDLESLSRAVPRVIQVCSPEIISHSMDAFYSVAKGLSDSGASLNLIREEGISGLTKYVPLACAGLINGAGEFVEQGSTSTTKINLPGVDDYDSKTVKKESSEQNVEEEKKGHGLLYVSTIGGALLLAAGVYVYTQITGESTGTPPQSTGIDPVSDPIIPVETDTPDYTPDATPTIEPTQESTPTAEPTQEPTPIETPIESQHLYDINPDKFDYIKIEADENLFNTKIEGSKLFDSISGWEIVYNDNVEEIFKRETYTPSNFDAYSELQPDQARALEDQYGSIVSLTMEQVDTDGDGQLDTVAVRYEGIKPDGSKGTLEFETDIMKNANGRILNVGPGSYISAHMY